MSAALGAAALLGPGRQLLVDGAGSLARGAPNMNSLIALGAVTSFTAGSVSALVPGTFSVTATSEGKSGSLIFNPLLNNTPISVSGPLNSAYSWFITVPAGATSITVTLTGTGSQDPDLEVYRPGATTPACASEFAGPNESCVITTSVSAGSWRVRVLGYTAYSGVTLRAVIAP